MIATAFEIDDEFAYKIIDSLYEKYEFSEGVNGIKFVFSFSIYPEYRPHLGDSHFLKSYHVFGVTGCMVKGSSLYSHARKGRTKTEIPAFISESDAENWFYETALENMKAIKTEWTEWTQWYERTGFTISPK